ncbi:5-hydroxytryptamine receptor 4-like [Silurus meridionalis]|nr:5-hydroxytryptamine receptor 4-like [Silurus meridionalis]
MGAASVTPSQGTYVLKTFYTCTIESVLMGSITFWFGNSTMQDRRALQRVVRSAERNIHTELPNLQDIYCTRCRTRARKIVKDLSHPNNGLFSLLRSGKRFRSLWHLITGIPNPRRTQEWAKGEQAGNVQPAEYGKISFLAREGFNCLEFTMANSSAWTDLSNKSFIGYLECAKARSLSLRVALYSFIMVGIFCTVVGNVLVVLAIAYFKQLQSHTNSFVMSLAVADFLVGLVVMPYSMIRTVEGCWNFGKMFCQLHSSLDVMLCTASIFHLSCIAFDRYYAICNPLVYSFKMSRSRVALLIVICWAVPLLISFGPILLGLHELGLDVPLPENVCVLLVNRVYAIIASLVAFYLPMATMLFAYWKIYKAAKRQAMQISALESQMAAGMGKSSSKKLKHRNYLRREKKAAKTLGIIMGVFILFWLPFFTVNIVDPFIEYQTTSVIWDIFLWLGYINSSLNPFLYGFFNRSFRRAFLMIMGCRICLPGSAPSMDLSHSKKDTNEHTEK